MSCPNELDLFQLREGGLSESQLGEVAQHVASCQSCQGALADLDALTHSIARPDTLSPAEKEELVSSVVMHIEDKKQPAPVLAPRKLLLGLPLAAAVSCGIVALLYTGAGLDLENAAPAPMPALSASTATPSQDLELAPPPPAARSVAMDRAARGTTSRVEEEPLGRTGQRPSAINSQGRFATTYRPGRGHLARFESSMFQGKAPEAALALVADVGRGARPALAPPQSQALEMHVDTELGQLPPGGGPMHLAITIRSTDRRPEGRPQMAVHLVMDTSGSMSGAAMRQARQAALRLVSLLDAQDRFSLVAYGSTARVVVSEGSVGPRRAAIEHRIRQARAGGGTNLEAGLRLGYEQAATAAQNGEAVQLLVVLSDGRANRGITDPWELSEMSAAAFQRGCETTAVGVGDRYDPLVMSTIADQGAGGYYYLPDASHIEQVLRAELEVRSQPVARGVELRVTLAPGIELLQAFGSRRLNELESARVRSTEVAIDGQSARRDDISQDRQEDHAGGMRFFIPGFARDDQHTILLRLRVPPGHAEAPRQIADLQLRYKDRLLRQNGADETGVELRYAHHGAQAFATQDRVVTTMVLTFRTGQALVRVSDQLATGDRPGALATLTERSLLLRAASGQLGDSGLAARADRLEAFAEVLASQSAADPLMMSSLAQSAGTGYLR